MRHLAVLLVTVTLVLATRAAHAAPAPSDVEYRADGSVRVGSEVFATREAFHHSQYFIDSGARCGTPATSADVMNLISPADCGGNSTTINQDYNDGRTLIIPVVFHVIKKTDG